MVGSQNQGGSTKPILTPEPPSARLDDGRPYEVDWKHWVQLKATMNFSRLQRASEAHSPIVQQVTHERIQRALDQVAEIIVARGEKGEDWLPLYERLERALAEC